MRSDEVSAVSGGVNCGVVIGAFVGLGLGIWASVEYLEPAFNETHGINDAGAKALTALVDLGGGLEFAMGAGALAGAIVVSMLACCYCCCKPSDKAPTTLLVSNNRSTMYASSASQSLETRAAAEVVSAELKV